MTEEIKIYDQMIGKTFHTVKYIKSVNGQKTYTIVEKFYDDQVQDYAIYDNDVHSDVIIFENDEESFIFYHDQSCCEYVHVDDIVGELALLENTPILVAEEFQKYKSIMDDDSDYMESHETYTFYKFATVNGHVDVKWYGTSNGYYSESVDMYHTVKEGN